MFSAFFWSWRGAFGEHWFWEKTRSYVGCGKQVSKPRVTDRDGWWHIECEQKAWQDSDMGLKTDP